MAANPKFSNVCVNAQADEVATLLNDGYIRLYTGSQPAAADLPITTQTLLVELRFALNAFPDAVLGVILAHPIADTVGLANGTAAWARVLQADGSTVMFDGSVGTSNANVIVNTLSIVSGRVVSCLAFTFAVSKG